MDLHTLEKCMPGETGNRAVILDNLAKRMAHILPDDVEIIPLSYNDMECMWLSFKYKDRIARITRESCEDVLDGLIDIEVWFKDE